MLIRTLPRLALAAIVGSTLAMGAVAGPALAADSPQSGASLTVRKAGGDQQELTVRKAGGEQQDIIAIL